MTKRFLACLLALVMLLSVSAATAEVVFPLEEEVTLTAFVLGMEGGVNYESNYVTQWIKEKTNINLKFVYAGSGEDGKTKLNLMLYSNEKLPDVFINTRWSKAECMLYGQEGIVIPLNQYLENSPNWNRLNELSPARRGDLTMSDGNIYTYGDDNECFHCSHQARMWIYQPWVDLLNDGVLPTTTDELYDFLVKVKTQDPNGNGKADEIPMTGYLDGWATDPFVFISNSFVQNNNFISNTNPTIAGGFVIDGDKIVYNLKTEAYRDALRYMNKLFKEGLLDSQTYTQTSDQCNATMDNEEHLVAVMGGGPMPQNADFWGARPGQWQKWTLLPPLKGPDGVQLAFTGLDNYFGTCVGLVSSDCEHPELAVAMFDLLASEEGNRVQNSGVEGISWKWTDELPSLSGGTSRWVKLIPEKTKEDGTTDWAAYGYDFEDATWDADGAIRCDTAAMRESEGVEDPELNGEAVLYRAALTYHEYAADVATIVPNMPFTEEQSKLIAEYTLSVDAYANSATIRFITGDMDIEADWEAYLAELNKMDVDGYVKVMQDAYDAYKASLSK